MEHMRNSIPHITTIILGEVYIKKESSGRNTPEFNYC